MFGCSARFQTDDVGGSTPWVPGEMAADAKACWDQDYADGKGGGDGWIVGENHGNASEQSRIRAAADHGWGAGDNYTQVTERACK